MSRDLLTVVMYHYTRPLVDSAWPRLKALELDRFHGQLDWLQENYTPITGEMLQKALKGQADLPPMPCLLTFDDGYSDHYRYAFPALRARGMSGLFFAPFSSLCQGQVLEVNKIQFTLAALDNPCDLAEDLDDMLRARGFDIGALHQSHLTPNRLDDAKVAYAKRLLQHALPPELRSELVNALFKAHVTSDEAAFARELYLTPSQAREMRAGGMEFGGHGDLHLWHGQSTAAELQREITGSEQALKAIGAPIRDGYYCYPFGSQNQATLDLVKATGFSIGFTTEPTLCDIATTDPLRIARLDTNDLPHSPGATSAWPQRAKETTQ